MILALQRGVLQALIQAGELIAVCIFLSQKLTFATKLLLCAVRYPAHNRYLPPLPRHCHPQYVSLPSPS